MTSLATRSSALGQRTLSILSYIALVLWAASVTIPLVWAAISSLKSDNEILASPLGLPSTLHWDNYGRAWGSANIGAYVLNTVIVVSGGLVLTLLLASMFGFILAKFRFPGRSALVGLIVISMTFPVILALVPLFFVVRNLGLMDTPQGLILVYAAFGIPFSTFVLSSFFSSIPDELIDAARIDGCGYWGAFFRVVLPLAKPGLVSVGIINVLSMWNQYMLPMVLVSKKENYVLAQGLATLAVEQGYRADWGALFAGMMIATIPVLVIYLIFERRIQAGIAAGGIKA